MKRVFMLILALIIMFLVFFHYPKQQSYLGEKESIECNCFGFSYVSGFDERRCIGLPFSCSIESHEEWFFKQDEEICEVRDCSLVREYLGITEHSEESASENYKRTDLLIMIDTSLSMKGERIEETKKSAIQFVRELSPYDRCAVISFNSKSRIVHSFSNDKESVISAIQNITVEEDTRYIPALTLAKSEFLTLDKVSNRKIMIILSDGDPLDDPDVILNLADDIKSEGVEIFTIRFGFEIRTDILEQLATINPEGVKGFYVSENVESLYSSFKKIYESFKEEDYLFMVVPRVNRSYYYEGDDLIFSYDIFSQENLYVVPGFFVDGEKYLCVKKADATLYLNSESNSYEIPLSYVLQSYVGSIESLPLGKYDASVNVSISYGSDCIFEDYLDMGTISVIKRDETEENAIVDCEFVREAVNDLDMSTHLYFHPQNRVLLAVDTSESISHKTLVSARIGFMYLLDLVLHNSKVGIIDFNQEARLVQPFTQKRWLLESHIGNLSAGGSTAFKPVFDKAYNLFSFYEDNLNPVFILVSDGFMWDEVSNKEIIDSVDNLVSQGVCVYTVGLGDEQLYDAAAQRILRQISSRNKADCGGYRHAYAEELPAVFKSIYKDMHNITEDLYFTLSLNKQKLILGDPFILEANVHSYYNNIFFPSVYQKGSYMYDLPPVDVSMHVLKDGNLVYEGPIHYYGNQDYSSVLKAFDPGKYDVIVNASVIINGSVCNITGTEIFSIVYIDEKEEKKHAYIAMFILFDIFLIIGMGLLSKKIIS
jgi:Mg-chelatase subunit ChlD